MEVCLRMSGDTFLSRHIDKNDGALMLSRERCRFRCSSLVRVAWPTVAMREWSCWRSVSFSSSSIVWGMREVLSVAGCCCGRDLLCSKVMLFGCATAVEWFEVGVYYARGFRQVENTGVP